MDCSCTVRTGHEVWLVSTWVSGRAGRNQNVTEVQGGSCHFDKGLLRPGDWDVPGLFNEVDDFGCCGRDRPCLVVG